MELSEQTLHEFLNTMPAVLYEYSQSPDGNNEILYVSPSAKEILGHPGEYFLGDIAHFLELIHPDDRARFMAEDEATIDDSNFFIEIRILLPSGEAKWIRCNAKPTSKTKEGTVIWCGCVIDITPLKQIEEALKKANDDLETKVEQRTYELTKVNEALNIKTRDLEKANAALSVLLDHRSNEKKQFEKNILSNMDTLILPYLKKMRESKSKQSTDVYLDIFEKNLKEIISPFSATLSSQLMKLTPTEIQVANLINGMGKHPIKSVGLIHFPGRFSGRRTLLPGRIPITTGTHHRW